MAKYEKIVTTEAGLELLAAAYAGGTITFTALRTGNGSYTGSENLAGMTALKRVRQTFSISSVTRKGSQVKVRSVITNTDLTEEYSVTEIGLYAKGSTGTEVLFAIIVAGVGGGDYLPAYELAPTSITMELYIEITDSDNGATFVAEVIEGAYVPVESFSEHVTDSTIHITAAERSTWNAKLATSGNASNTTVAFTEASTLAAITTGSKLSALFGTVAKAIKTLISHLANVSNPHSVTKAQVGLGSVDNTSDLNKPISTATQTELDKKALAADLTSHTGSTSNPHSVTKTQVGLGNVPNVATNDQTPSYTVASTLAALATGEKLNVAFGKLAKAVSDLISHLANKSNPHGVTKAQVGLGSVDNTSDLNKPISTATQTELDKKALAADLTTHTGNTSNPHSVTKAQVGLSNVPNVATNDQTPTYTAASSLTALTSGEKLSVALGKLSKAVSELISHIANSVSHITAAERTAWNAKADQASLSNYLPLSGGTMMGPFIMQTWARIKANFEKGAVPASGIHVGVGIYDKHGTETSNLLGHFQTTVDSAGNISTKMAAFNNQAGSSASVGISCIYRTDGMSYTEAPTPPTGDNSTKIATTAFVKNQKYLPMAGGRMLGDLDMAQFKIKGCAGTYADSLGDQYSHAGIEIREKDFISTASNDIGYAPALGFHWAGTVGSSIFMDAVGDFHFVRSDGNYCNLKTATSNVIISDIAPTDTTVLWVDTTSMKIKLYKNGAWATLS